MSTRLMDRQNHLISQFSQLTSWQDRYKKLIALGKKLPVMDKSKKSEDVRITGCQSRVWLMANMDDKKQIHFEGDSDAMIARGLLAILIQIYSNATAEEILNTPAEFIKKIGFETNLSPSRSNGLYSMIKQIMYYATAFKALNESDCMTK